MIDKQQLTEILEAENNVKRLASQFKFALKGQKNVDEAEKILDEYELAVYDLLDKREMARDGVYAI